MIQRIQSLYILIYIANKCFLLYITPIDSSSFRFLIHEYDLFTSVQILLIIFSTITLLSFKSRKNQIILLYFLIIIQAIILTSIPLIFYEIDNSMAFFQNYQTFLYLFGLFLLLVSLWRIKKDQKLVDSIDRIR